MEWRGFNFEIVDMDGHRIDKILVTPSQEIMDSLEEEK
jgi:putative hemolysin